MPLSTETRRQVNTLDPARQPRLFACTIEDSFAHAEQSKSVLYNLIHGKGTLAHRMGLIPAPKGTPAKTAAHAQPSSLAVPEGLSQQLDAAKSEAERLQLLRSHLTQKGIPTHTQPGQKGFGMMMPDRMYQRLFGTTSPKKTPATSDK